MHDSSHDNETRPPASHGPAPHGPAPHGPASRAAASRGPAPDWLELDPLDAGAIRAMLDTRRFGDPLEIHPTLPSTLDRIRRLGEEGAGAGTVVLAEEQTAGRGRRGRPWLSAPGVGVWLSLLIEVAGRPPGVLTLSTAVAVRRAILAAGGPAVSVKWPNDLEVGGRKVCGILCEVAAGPLVALGIGLNVHHTAADLPAELAGRATSLDAAGGGRMARNVLVARLLEALEAMDDALRSAAAPRWLDAWRAACGHLGRRVRVVATPDAAWSGVMEGIDADGALLLRLPSGEQQTVLAGSLTVLDEPDSTASPGGVE